ncbi:hypothetical protein SMD44_02411 [Streptomyces alboflavus]|uniref:Uncharacterized protein n=1 Tax=Streptomyces alboflavus TaxID=67267 RepID=A0A1Z1W9B9_9ACTN|nr:hypothetical protein [Streptomyces alboflavus]ARX82997.1 hypothetical protein SMD44_02411 [Streptomyces alboflavus]
MTALLGARVVELAEPVRCGDCAGKLQVVDTDGTLGGITGAIIPCVCTDLGNGYKCGCWVYGWPMNDGFTGWVPIPPAEWDWDNIDEQLTFRPCPDHVSCIVTASPEVAA